MSEDRLKRVKPKILPDNVYYAFIDTLYSKAYIKAKLERSSTYYDDVMAYLYEDVKHMREKAEIGSVRTIVALCNTMRMKKDYVSYYGSGYGYGYIYEFNDAFLETYFKGVSPMFFVRELKEFSLRLEEIKFISVGKFILGNELVAGCDLNGFISDADMARSIISVWEKRHGKDTDTGED